MNITAGMDYSINEFEKIVHSINNISSNDTTIVVGSVIKPDIEEELRLTLIATVSF